jgi:FdhD protein
MQQPARSHPVLSIRVGVIRTISRELPEETAIAMVYEGSTQAVMMASPADLGDFAVGFSLSERIVDRPGEIESLEVAAHQNGIELRMWLSKGRSGALTRRRRFVAGPVGCGLCGIDSLDEALRPLPSVTARSPVLTTADVEAAAAALANWQPLHDRTRAVHAAAFYRPGEGILAAREDVGRHNALDKLIGALALDGVDASTGAVVLTSRVSVEMVQKSVLAGAPVVIAVSAPTAHAVRLAEGAGMTLVGLARGGGFEVFTQPRHIGNGDRCDADWQAGPHSHVANVRSDDRAVGSAINPSGFS